MTILSLFGGPTKRSICDGAFEQAGQSNYNNQLEPEEYNSALVLLNNMLAEWEGLEGIPLGYNYPTDGFAGDPSDESGIPPYAVQAVTNALAFRINPTLGKTTSGETRATLNRSIALLRAKVAIAPQMQLSRTTIRGAGNTRWGRWRGNYYYPVVE